MRVQRAHAAAIVLVVGAVLVWPRAACAMSTKNKDGWYISAKAAFAAAKKTDKLVLANFTGSDWCGWCKRLKAEVFADPAFKTWAKKNVILLEVDFPRGKSQPAFLKKQNQELSEKYRIRGFPTILFLTANGESVGTSGYQKGGAVAWTKSAQSFVDNKPKPKIVEPRTDLAVALDDAKKQSRPLLLVLVNPKIASTKRKLAALYKDKGFASLTEGSALVVQKDFPLPDDAPAAEKEALSKLQERFKINKAPLQFQLVSPEGDKVLYRSVTSSPHAKLLVSSLRKAMPAVPYSGEWLEDFGKAKAIAAQMGRPMLLDFTGSDWCGWCVRLDKEVFQHEAFKKYAAANIVLVKLDFPRRKKIAPAIKAQNERLAGTYGLRGFPTIIMLDAKGKELGKMGYMAGGPSAFIKKLKTYVR